MALMSCVRNKALTPPFPHNVPPMNDQASAHFGVAGNWKNPYLIIYPNGVKIRHLPDLISPENLKDTLGTLPLSEWPYGRVVALQEVGIVSGDDDQMIDLTMAEVEAILNQLEIHIERWPH